MIEGRHTHIWINSRLRVFMYILYLIFGHGGKIGFEYVNGDVVDGVIPPEGARTRVNANSHGLHPIHRQKHARAPKSQTHNTFKWKCY